MIQQHYQWQNLVWHKMCRYAWTTYGKLWDRVFEDRNLRLDTKVLVYKAIILHILLYGSETLTMYWCHINTLEKLHQCLLFKIFKIKWQDHWTNISVLEESDCTRIECLIVRNRLCWAGHVVHMSDQAYPKKIFYSELRSIGRQKKMLQGLFER